MAQPFVMIQPSKGWFHLDLKALWQYRELLYFLVWRDVKLRYKQTVIGAAWVILQPLITIAIFTVVFGNLVKIPSDGLPYAIFAYTALLPWSYFSQALTRCGASTVQNAHLVTKVYIPRLFLPMDAVTTPVVDFSLSLPVLLALIIWFRIVPTWGVLALPLFLLLSLMTALGVGLFLAGLNVRYRDVAYIIPFLVQLWMYASPVVYPVSLLPEKWRLLYMLNPMAVVIEGFRWALLGQQSPNFGVMAVSTAVVLVLLLGGIAFFKHAERTFADVV